MVRIFTDLRFEPFQPREECHSQRPRTVTRLQDDESWAIREAARQRLAEQRRCEREATRQREWLANKMRREREARQERETIR